jgi:hypothetical protein
VFGLRRWFGFVDSSCWFVDVQCRWFQFSSEEPVLTEILTVTGANNNWKYLQWTSTNQQLESTKPNHRRRPSTTKLFAPVTVDISEEPVLTEILTVTGANNLIVLCLRFFSARSSPVGYLDVLRLYTNWSCIVFLLNCKVTILETPVYSIYHWNCHRKHKSPDEFKDQDSTLADQIIRLKTKVKELKVFSWWNRWSFCCMKSHSHVFSISVNCYYRW